MNGADPPPLILRRRDRRRVVVRWRLRLGAIACRHSPHILGRWKGGPCFYILRPRPRTRPRPRARPRPRPRRGGLGGLGLEVRVDVRRTEGRPPSSYTVVTVLVCVMLRIRRPRARS